MEKRPITPEGQKKLRAELDQLKNVKRQDILAQIYRDPNDALEVVDVKPGQGL